MRVSHGLFNVTGLLALTLFSACAVSHQVAPNLSGRLKVLPILFIPSDVEPDQAEVETTKKLLNSHLRMARAFYKKLLVTDTFEIVSGEPVVYRARQNTLFYSARERTDQTDSAHIIVRELFDWRKDNRFDSHYIYLVVFFRQNNKPEYKDYIGGGRTFNGLPNRGGGYVGIEASSLFKDLPYPFQSTLVHELGHAFGLAHVDCYGYDVKSNDSIMSYNPEHHSVGTRASTTPGGLNPEEYYVLSLNKRAFPNFMYDTRRHNPGHKVMGDLEKCYLTPMGEQIGDYKRIPGYGYELFINGKLSNGPETIFYSRKQAVNSCRWNHGHYRKKAKIICKYDGTPFMTGLVGDDYDD